MTPRIKIYGERNTGTNYLARLIRLNLNAALIPGVVPRWVHRLQRVLPGSELLKDLYFALTARHNLGWKHTRVTPDRGLEKRLRARGDLFFLTVTKNPYSWLLSLHKRPYHRHYHEKPDFETFLQMPWTAVRRDRCSRTLKSPVELWNVKNASYLELTGERCMNLRSEDVLADPGAAIEEIGARFSIEARTPAFINYERSTNREEKGFQDYQAYYMNQDWKKLLSAEAIAIINRGLDFSLAAEYGYERIG